MSLVAGFKELNPSPKTVGIITWLSKKTEYTVEGWTLLCDQFGASIVGVVQINMRKVDKDFTVEKVRCVDGIRMTGKVSISFHPDSKSLRDYDDIGQEAGFIAQVDDILVTGSQAIADGKDYIYMETQSVEIGRVLKERIESFRPAGDNDASDDTRGLGVVLDKVQAKFWPISDKVIIADEDPAIEGRQRTAELAENKTIEQQMLARRQTYVDNAKTKEEVAAIPSLKACREEIIEERLAREGKVVGNRSGGSGGGRTVNLNNINR